MKVLIIGSGAREEALGLALRQSPELTALYAAPGHAGLASLAHCLALDIRDAAAVVDAARARSIDLVVIGPEAPLAAGLSDQLRAAGIAVFGPDAAAARIEGSKAFMKRICADAGIPTAPARIYTAEQADAARADAASAPLPLVIKADGLAAGKGVFIAETRADADAALKLLLVDRQLGPVGSVVLLEEFLPGEELSYFALADGQGRVLPLTAAQDHKRAWDGDRGPNTGGMGAYSPAPLLTPALDQAIQHRILRPLEAALRAAGAPFCGVLFLGLMIRAGSPWLLEVNCRFGDPEAQVILPRLATDFLALARAVATGRLDQAPPLAWRPLSALGVVMAAKGYPGPAPPSIIQALPEGTADALIFQAGTRQDAAGVLHAGTGRTLTVVGLGETLPLARDAAYRHVGRVAWPDGQWRSDIGWRALQA